MAKRHTRPAAAVSRSRFHPGWVATGSRSASGKEIIEDAQMIEMIEPDRRSLPVLATLRVGLLVLCMVTAAPAATYYVVTIIG